MKQALKASGANITQHHIEEVSMCATFLLRAAKRTDKDFLVTPQSTSHTVRSATDDIQKIFKHLLGADVTNLNSERTSPAFIDPTESGFKNVTGPMKRALNAAIVKFL